MEMAEAIQAAHFAAYMRERIERATEQEIDLIFPQVSGVCENCHAESAACRSIFSEEGTQCVCEECFRLLLAAFAAVVYGQVDLLSQCDASFTFRAIGKCPPDSVN